MYLLSLVDGLLVSCRLFSEVPERGRSNEIAVINFCLYFLRRTVHFK